MSDKWKDLGKDKSLLEMLIPGDVDLFGVSDHLVRNEETGEEKIVYVSSSQTVGEAIEKGQFKKD